MVFRVGTDRLSDCDSSIDGLVGGRTDSFMQSENPKSAQISEAIEMCSGRDLDATAAGKWRTRGHLIAIGCSRRSMRMDFAFMTAFSILSRAVSAREINGDKMGGVKRGRTTWESN